MIQLNALREGLRTEAGKGLVIFQTPLDFFVRGVDLSVSCGEASVEACKPADPS